MRIALYLVSVLLTGPVLVTGRAALETASFPDPADQLLKLEDLSKKEPQAFKLSATLGNHMVLQRAPASAVVWGFAEPGTAVTATFDGEAYTATAGNDTVWRVNLRPTAAGGPYSITFKTCNGAQAVLKDVLFGDVYVCGGQSNMQFSIGGNVNAKSYAKEADGYPDIRLFTVGQGTSSTTPLLDLHTVKQGWAVASASSVTDGTAFNYFSAVCWFFGRAVHAGLGGKVPIGLVSNNWGGTKDEQWMPAETSVECGHESTGELYNAMIHPYTVGPMAITGFTWYQGEADLTKDPAQPDLNYTCTQAAMVQLWRTKLQAPGAWFGAVQLSTWMPPFPLLLARLRDQQLDTANLIPNFAVVTNADYGAGPDIHPPYKQYVGARLANAALSMVYGQQVHWRSPSYAAAQAVGEGKLQVWLKDVAKGGLLLKPPFNLCTANCTQINEQVPGSCAWASLQFNDGSWVNATVGLSPDKQALVLSAPPPSGATSIVASAYGFGSIPLLSVYLADQDGQEGQLPVLPWNRTLPGPASGLWAPIATMTS